MHVVKCLIRITKPSWRERDMLLWIFGTVFVHVVKPLVCLRKASWRRIILITVTEASDELYIPRWFQEGGNLALRNQDAPRIVVKSHLELGFALIERGAARFVKQLLRYWNAWECV